MKNPALRPGLSLAGVAGLEIYAPSQCVAQSAKQVKRKQPLAIYAYRFESVSPTKHNATKNGGIMFWQG